MRLIDAEELERLFNEQIEQGVGVIGAFDAFYDALQDTPTVDAVEVVHGRWNNMDGYKTRKVCSECGWDVPEYGKFYSYCPNCGAKMDGGDGDAAE